METVEKNTSESTTNVDVGLKAKIVDLKVAIGMGKLSKKDAGFAANLCAYFDKYDKLSDKQLYWVNKFLGQAVSGGDTSVMKTSQKSTNTKTEMMNVGDYQGVYSLFDTAKSGLKFPKLHLRTNDGKKITIQKQLPSGTFPGMIRAAVPYQKFTLPMVVAPNGDLKYISHHYPQPLREEMFSLLVDLGLDPVGTLAKHGKKTCVCCFCAAELTDTKSLEVGYGPVCAKHWGLPWGTYAVGDVVAKKTFEEMAPAIHITQKNSYDPFTVSTLTLQPTKQNLLYILEVIEKNPEAEFDYKGIKIPTYEMNLLANECKSGGDFYFRAALNKLHADMSHTTGYLSKSIYDALCGDDLENQV